MTLKMRSRSPKSNHFFPLSWWCICASLVKFQPLVQEIVCTQAFFLSKFEFQSAGVTLKMRSWSPKSNHFIPHPNNVAVLVWSNSIYWFMRQCTQSSFSNLYNVMTLKMRSRSPKSNHFFPLSWWCICASLVKFQPLVQEILCTQAFFYQNLGFKVPVWPWKCDQGHQNLITLFPHSSDVPVLVWSNSIYWFMR